VSKYRKQIFNEGSYRYFELILKGILEPVPEVEVITMNHDKDHIHLHISIPPKMKISDVVRRIKSNSGRMLKRKFEYMRKAYWGVDGIWSDGYFVSTVGVNDTVIKQYIQKQGQEDKGQTKFELG